ncbi:MAG TPA: glycosyl hydrolase family 8 [Azospirillaceae bacterium]|nr:glycosyl hydrolase family 8 [Azospirillaceae bacterium]
MRRWGVLVAVMVAVLVPRGTVAGPLDPAEWLTYRSRFVLPEGRVVDTGNKGISHSEGQGYGMLLAAAFEDRPTFDLLWRWTRQALQVRGDALFAWKWEPAAGGQGRVADRNSASDGDLLIAWALLRGERRWSGAGYGDAARAILADVRRRLVVDSPAPGVRGPVLLPGPEGFRRDDGSIVVNLSYWLFPAFNEFAAVDPGGPWADLVRTGVELVRQARFGAWRLPPDWLLLGERTVPARGFGPAVFGYNAVRVPLNLVWGRAGTPEDLRPFAEFWSRFDGAPYIPATVDLTTDALADYGLFSGGRAISVLVRFGTGGADAGGTAGAMMPRPSPQDDYYAASLLLLARIALLEGMSP